MTPRGQAAAQHDDQDEITLDGLRDQFFVAHRACERFSKVLGGIAQKLQESKADDPWLTEVGEPAACMQPLQPQLLTDSVAGQSDGSCSHSSSTEVPPWQPQCSRALHQRLRAACSYPPPQPLSVQCDAVPAAPQTAHGWLHAQDMHSSSSGSGSTHRHKALSCTDSYSWRSRATHRAPGAHRLMRQTP
jgi:hypothetical protein